RLVPAAVNLTAVTVTATVPIAVDTRTGNQVFQQNEYHGAPTNTTSQILQLSIAGAARAPTGEVHIRGQHAEYTYYVDGAPVPAGISGSLNELFDPQVVNQINFETGGWDAQYGNKNAAIVNVTTKIPAGGFHGDIGSYVGTYDASTTTSDRGLNCQPLTLPTNNTITDDHQTDVNSFANLGWRPQFGAVSQSENADLFAALFYRHGTLDYVPGEQDTPGFTFFPDPNQYTLSENRQFNTFGVKL